MVDMPVFPPKFSNHYVLEQEKDKIYYCQWLSISVSCLLNTFIIPVCPAGRSVNLDFTEVYSESKRKVANLHYHMTLSSWNFRGKVSGLFSEAISCYYSLCCIHSKNNKFVGGEWKTEQTHKRKSINEECYPDSSICSSSEPSKSGVPNP